MNRRVLLAGLALLPLKAHAQGAVVEMIGGGGAIWRQKVVTVHVYTDARWHPYLATSFADLKRVGGKRLPKFHVQYHTQKNCQPQMGDDYASGTMVICSTPRMSWASAWTNTNPKRHGLDFVKIMLNDEELVTQPAAYNQNSACHEIMHGVTWVNDNYGHNPGSCVHGDVPHPGPHDKKLIQRMYRKHRERKGGRR